MGLVVISGITSAAIGLSWLLSEDGKMPTTGSTTNFRLVRIPGKGKWVMLRNDVAEALLKMQNAAKQASILAPLLLPFSGYRTKAEQQVIWDRALAKYGSETVARKWVARPGYSAHATGRAVDLWLGEGSGSSGNATKLQTTQAWKWLRDNAIKFGFYPYLNEEWHWEYGAPHDSTGNSYAQEYNDGIAKGWLT